MAILLEASNFQSFIHVKSKLDGFTTIQGGSNRGKTAIVRILRTILYNEWLPSYLRKGTKECIISLTFDTNVNNVKKITLIKPSNSYRVEHWDGTQDGFYPKVGKEVPVEIKDMNFRLIVTEREDKFNMNFQGQLDTLFLVGESSNVVVTSFFNKVFDVAKYEKALREIQTDSTKFNTKYNLKISDLEVFTGVLKDHEDTLQLTQDFLNSVQNLYKEYGKIEQQIFELDYAIQSAKDSYQLAFEIDQGKVNQIQFKKVVKYLGKYIFSFDQIQEISSSEFKIGTEQTEFNNLQVENQGLRLVQDKFNKYTNLAQNLFELNLHILNLDTSKDELSSFQSEYLILGVFQKHLIQYIFHIKTDLEQSQFLQDLSRYQKELANFQLEYKVCVGVVSLLKGQVDISEQLFYIKQGIEDLNQTEESLQISISLEDETKRAKQLIIEIEIIYKETVKTCPLCNRPYDGHKTIR